jgi:hypothetical protein
VKRQAQLFILFVLTAVPSFAQATPPHVALSASCNGLWSEVESAAREVRLLHVPLNSRRAEDLACVLTAIDSTPFDARDQQANELFASEATRLLVEIHGGEALDFFAGQMAAQPASVHRRLAAVLLEHGHPVAVREYFEVRRAKLGRKEPWNRESSPALGIFGPILERGTCAAAVCTEHLAETTQLVRANLDILDLELAAIAERPMPRSQSEFAGQEAEVLRAAARRVRQQIGRIARGETVVGTAPAR